MAKYKTQIVIKEREPGESDLTSRQLDYIRHLMDQLEVESGLRDRVHELGKWQASQLIDQLKDLRNEYVGHTSDITRIDDEPKGSSRALIVLLVIIAIIFAINYFADL